jgi:hypothetical protein
MLGAMELDMSVLTGRQMINIDSEEEGTVTVSCAGGADVTATLPLAYQTKQGTRVTLAVKGLQGGHSGTEINSGRINADLLTVGYWTSSAAGAILISSGWTAATKPTLFHLAAPPSCASRMSRRSGRRRKGVWIPSKARSATANRILHRRSRSVMPPGTQFGIGRRRTSCCARCCACRTV